MALVNDFTALQAFWDSMSCDERANLVNNLGEFTGLISSLKGRKIIEVDKNMTHIKVLKKDPDVKRLKELLKLTGARGIKIE